MQSGCFFLFVTIYSAVIFKEDRMFNFIKSGLLIIVMTLLMMFIGDIVGGPDGAWGFFAVSMLFNFFSYFFSDKIVLAAYGAQPVDQNELGWLHETLAELAAKAELPVVPRLYLIPTEEANAFATGRNPKHAVVAVTEGLLRNLNRNEIAAVIAHELGHVKHRDILISTIVASMASAIMWISRILLFFGGGRRNRDNAIVLLLVAIIAPIAATLIQLAVSRSREYLADDYSAKLMGSGEFLIDALYSLHGQARPEEQSVISASTAHMFIFPPVLSGMSKLFSTHPSLEDRVRNLRNK